MKFCKFIYGVKKQKHLLKDLFENETFQWFQSTHAIYFWWNEPWTLLSRMVWQPCTIYWDNSSKLLTGLAYAKLFKLIDHSLYDSGPNQNNFKGLITGLPMSIYLSSFKSNIQILDKKK